MKFLAFDLETAKIVPPDEDVQAHRPLGISCAAVARFSFIDNAIVTRDFCGVDENGYTTPRLTEPDCRSLVHILQRYVERGFTLLTWNGLGFDFDILAEESGMHEECATLARNSVDMMYQAHCLRGFPIGLDSVAKAIGLSGKTEGVSGAQAPDLWADGQYSTVLEYVQQDARTTLEVALWIEQHGYLKWTAKSGRLNRLDIARWLTVDEASALPLPDTSWMTEPLPRARFTGWLERVTS